MKQMLLAQPSAFISASTRLCPRHPVSPEQQHRVGLFGLGGFHVGAFKGLTARVAGRRVNAHALCFVGMVGFSSSW